MECHERILPGDLYKGRLVICVRPFNSRIDEITVIAEDSKLKGFLFNYRDGIIDGKAYGNLSVSDHGQEYKFIDEMKKISGTPKVTVKLGDKYVHTDKD